MSIRTRYAPSPTGDLHLGSLRTLLYAYLVAKQGEGAFLMRVEDTDQARTVEGSVKRQLEAMAWMGLNPDEGVCLDDRGKIREKGSYGPYTQSNRLPIYQKYANQLLQNGGAYRCFCTSERLAEMRAEQEKNHLPPRYDQHCRSLSVEQSDQRAKEENFVIRQAMPENREIRFTDLIRGEIIFHSKDLDDHVLMKSDGFPTYQLANVVDDHLMEITHVLRGEEWISSLPKNILLYESFDWTPPVFAHLPVILGPDGKHKLSKRDGADTILEYRDRGYMPEALLNVLAFVGWSPGTEEEFFTKEELIQRFQLEKVQKSAAVFSFDRLEYVCGWYARQLPLTQFVEKMLPFLKDAGLIEDGGPVEELAISGDFASYLRGVGLAVQQRLHHFDQAASLTRFFFERPGVSPEMLQLIVPKKGTLEGTMGVLQESAKVLKGIKAPWKLEDLEETLHLFINKNGYKNGEVLWPIRAALTGEAASPGAFEMLSILGKEESLIRLQGVFEAAN